MTEIVDRRDLPQVDALARRGAGLAPAPVVRRLARAVVDDARRRLAAGTTTSLAALEADLADRALSAGPLTPVLNATGVVLHTNLGRAPLTAVADPPLGAVALELDLATGARGGRFRAVEAALCALTGAEAALVVNNGAAAVLLALTALAGGGAAADEVLVSRGQLVEIGGAFRVPDIVVQGGASLREVGTTNRTHAADYRAAVGERTAVVLAVHPSNFAVVGFTAEVPTAELAAIAHEAGVPLVADLGSGLLDARCPWLAAPPSWLAGEPAARQSLADGADVVTFSGDKLLGGPQAGIVCGRADLVNRMRRHPLARALRFDKVRAGHLQATLDAYLDGRAATDVPFWALASTPAPDLRRRAEAVASALAERAGSDRLDVGVVATEDAVGAGSAADAGLAGAGVRLTPAGGGATGLAATLRRGTPAVVGLERDGAVVLALRAVPAADDPVLVAAVAAALDRVADAGP